jgi:hypothetical protein
MKMRTRSKVSPKIAAVVLTAAMTVSTAAPALAADKTTLYDAPTAPVSVSSSYVDGKPIITATAHRAASPLPDMLGMNTKSGFGMINGAAPTKLDEAKTKAALGIWGSSLNDSPDPYYWNYFYNFTTDDTVNNALLNSSVAASPMQADTNLVEEYGGVSVSLYTRPQVVIGVGSVNTGTDLNGYNDQLTTIHNMTSGSTGYYTPAADEYLGGEANKEAAAAYYNTAYNPQLVSYQVTTIQDTINTVKNTAAAMAKVTKETGAVGRYGDASVIANNYEKYIYGVESYILSQIAAGKAQKKTIAIVNSKNDDGTYNLSGEISQSATSSVRAVQYTRDTTTNLINKLNITRTKEVTNGRSGSTYYVATADQLKQADAIILMDNSSDISEETLKDTLGSDYKGMFLSTQPSTLYGMTMNSVENGMAYGYVLGYLYSDTLGTNPVDLCAYFYQKFYHISDLTKLKTIVKNNFADVTLPNGISSELSASYSEKAVESQLATGMNYYEANKASLSGTDMGKGKWSIDWNNGIGKGQKSTASNTGSSANTSTTKPAAPAKKTTTSTKKTTTVKKGTAFTVGKMSYKITSVSGKKVTLQKNKKTTAASATVPSSVKYKGKTYKVTAIAKNAFASNKKLKKVTIGKYVTSIGTKAFYKDKKLKTVVFKGKYVKTVGKYAFKSTASKVTYKAPKSVLKKYKKLIKKAGASSRAAYKAA